MKECGMATNSQYSDPGPLFGGAPGYASTGAPGIPGDSAAQTQGPVIASVPVSAPFDSAQVPSNHPLVAVTTGDTSAMSSDQAIGDNFAKISGTDAADLAATGAGTGHVAGPPHPNAGS